MRVKQIQEISIRKIEIPAKRTQIALVFFFSKPTFSRCLNECGDEDLELDRDLNACNVESIARKNVVDGFYEKKVVHREMVKMFS